MEWKTVKLGEVCDRVCSGGTPNSRNNKYYDGGIPWLNTKEIDFGRIYSTERTISQEGLDNSSAKWIDENSVIVAMYGATAGKVAVSKIRLTTNQACCNLHIDEKKADYNYVYYYLLNNFSILASLANGGAQQNLNAQIIKDFLISLPPLETQRRISGILSSLDDKIENNNRINANLEAQAQVLFKSWFIDFEPFGGVMPEDWREGVLSDLTEKIASGGTPSSMNKSYYTGNIKWFSTKELLDSFLLDSEKHISEEAYNNSAAKLFPAGTVLMAIYAAPTVGRLGILAEEATCNQAAVGIIPLCHIGKEYLYLLLKSERIKLNFMASGAAQQNLNVGIVKNYPVIIPSKHISMAFQMMVRPIFDKISNNLQENQRLATLRDTLLPKLMKGEIAL